MRISPLDIQQQQFKGKMFGGLDPEDVDQFLQTVAEAMEELLREIAELKAEAPLQPLEPPPMLLQNRMKQMRTYAPRCWRPIASSKRFRVMPRKKQTCSLLKLIKSTARYRE